MRFRIDKAIGAELADGAYNPFLRRTAPLVADKEYFVLWKLLPNGFIDDEFEGRVCGSADEANWLKAFHEDWAATPPLDRSM